MEPLNVFANYYYNFDFNVTHISLNEGDYHKNLRTTLYHFDQKLKAPSHEWENLFIDRQSLNELNNFDWTKAKGLGVVLGYKNLRALDIDDCIDIEIIYELLKYLKLPSNYEWVVKSGSQRGFHILFYADEHNYLTTRGRVRAFLPSPENTERFKHIELRWLGHLVLPPSMHPTYNQYSFISNQYPTKKPNHINIRSLETALDFLCTVHKKDDMPENVSGYYIDYEGNILNPYNHPFAKLSQDHPYALDISPYYLFIDIETNGLPKDRNLTTSDIENWPRIVQIAYISNNRLGVKLSEGSYLIAPTDFTIPDSSSKINNITHEYALKNGLPIKKVLEELLNSYEFKFSKVIVGHNIKFDLNVIESELIRQGFENILSNKETFCTMEKTVNFCEILNNSKNTEHILYKYPTLSELYYKLFEEHLEVTHNAMEDVKATARCYWKLRRNNYFWGLI